MFGAPAPSTLRLPCSMIEFPFGAGLTVKRIFSPHDLPVMPVTTSTEVSVLAWRLRNLVELAQVRTAFMVLLIEKGTSIWSLGE